MAAIAPTATPPRIRVRRAGWAIAISLVWLAILLVLAFLGPAIAPYDPAAIDLANTYASPSLQHPFGTDETGRAMFGASFWIPVIALIIAFMPVFGRILRTRAMRERNLPYVSSLLVQGQGRFVIASRHILPNLFPTLAVQSAVGFSYALLDLSAISYLGLGPQPPAADWGLLIAQGQSGILAGHPAQALIVSVLVLVTVLAMNVVGDSLSERFEMGER